MKNVAYCIGLTLLALAPTRAGDEALRELQGYINEIEHNNHEYLAALRATRAAEEKVAGASILPDPNLQVGVFAQEVETRVGPQKQRLGLSQMLPWKGKLRLQGERQQALAEAKGTEHEAVRLRLVTEFTQLYADYYYLGQAIAITGEHLSLLRDLEQVVVEKYQNSTAQYGDVVRIQIELDALTDRLRTQEASREPLSAAMKALLGRAAEQTLPFPSALPVPEIEAGWQERVMGLLKERKNPTLKTWAHKEAAERVSLDLAKKEYFPDLRLGIDWINTGEAVMPGVAESGKDPIVLSVGLNLPIWRKKYRADERSAAQRVEMVTEMTRETEIQLEAQMRKMAFRLDDALRKMQLYGEQIIPKAEEALKVTIIGFQTEEASYLDLIEAEKALLTFLLSHNQAKAARLQALAGMEAVLGQQPFAWEEEGDGNEN